MLQNKTALFCSIPFFDIKLVLGAGSLITGRMEH